MTCDAKPRFAYVGSYTSKERKGQGKGISVYGIDPATEKWNLAHVVPADNATFLCFDKTKRFLYSCQADGSLVSAYAVNETTGALTLLNTRAGNGKNGVHILPDPGNKFIIVVSSVVDVFPRNEDGSLGPCCCTIVPEGGFGPLKEQVVYCPHQGVFDKSGKYLLVPDKFLDGIHILRFDAASGKLAYHDPACVRARPGAGQRHLDWHPEKPFAYVMDENDNTVTTWQWDAAKGSLTPLQWVSSIPGTYFNPVKGGRDYGSGEIWVAPSGRFVYGSNRGHDSIVIYAVDEVSGLLNLVGWESSRGATPRFFCLSADGTRLFAANLNGHNIVMFSVDGNTGKLTPTGQEVAVGSPCCILFL
ncbi:lactonase family protein [Desulfovibrio sp. OttesenSCG-928-O18]|nr:lactonase family protein [Desulfovibrio sp. OttesenSCG-928-O18]